VDSVGVGAGGTRTSLSLAPQPLDDINEEELGAEEKRLDLFVLCVTRHTLALFPGRDCGCPLQDGDALVQPEFWYYEGSDSGWSARGSETRGLQARGCEYAISSTIEIPDYLLYNASPLRLPN
jgi:hypothetical protein